MNKTNAPQHENPSLSGYPWFGVLSQLDFDIEFFEQLFARDGTSTEVVRVLAELVAKKGLLDRAVELDRHLVSLLPEDALARYNLGCSLARAGCSKEAISSLSIFRQSVSSSSAALGGAADVPVGRPRRLDAAP